MTLENKGRKDKKFVFFRNCISLSAGQRRLLNIFCYTITAGTFVAMLGIILYYVYAFASLYRGNENFNWLLGIFSDFVSIMNAALADAPYVLDDGASYPPIAIMVLYPFALICKNVFSAYAHEEWINIDELTSQVILHPEFWIALVLFFVVCISSIVLIIIKKYRLNPVDSIKIAFVIIMSAPFVFAIMRGNTIYFALVFLLLFLLLYDHPKAWVRELSYICLVISGSIKIYPLFFGVFLLKKKKFFAAFRIAVYFFVLFFLSFHLFPDGMEGMNPFLENLFGFMSSDERLLSMRNLSVSSLLYKVFDLFSPSSTGSVGFTVVNLTMMIGLFLAATLTATVTRSNLSRSVIASAIVILIPTISYFYVLIFEIIPFMEFLGHYDSLPKWKRILYGTLFMFMFFTLFLMPQCFVPHALAVIVMMVIEEHEVIKSEIIPWCKRRKSLKQAT